MYDTVNNRLLTSDTGHVPALLQRVKETVVRETGESYLLGSLENLNVCVFEGSRVFVKGSLARFHLGTNLETLDREETARAFEHLSDSLHLPMKEANVSRLDLGTNFELASPLSRYLALLSEHSRYARNPVGRGRKASLCYHNSLRELKFYNKLEEMKKSKAPIPDILRYSNVLRYELTLFKPSKTFKESGITATMLYDPRFYDRASRLWEREYFGIPKHKELRLIDEIDMRTIQDLYRLGLTMALQREEDFALLLRKIESSDLSKSQRSRLRARLRELQTSERLTVENDLIRELDGKVTEAVSLYR